MKNTNFFRLLLSHLEEGKYNNVFQNLLQDADYLEATKRKDVLCRQFEELALSEEQQDTIKK